MSLDYGHVNWLAIVIAAAADILVGFIWYNPQVFGRRYAAAIGREPVNPIQLPVMTLVVGIAQALIVAYVLALFAGGLGAETLADGALVGFLVWLGFLATSTYSSVSFEGRSTEWWAISAGFYLVGGVVMGSIVGYWPA